MAASSSSNLASAVDTTSGKSLRIKPNTTSIPKDSFKVLIESVIDFDSLMRNGVQIARFFAVQRLNNFFKIHQGPTYTELVKNFWMKAEIVDEGVPEVEIRSNVMGLDVTITQSLIAKLLKTPEGGLFLKGTNSKSEWAKEIFKELHEDRDSEKAKDMRVEHRVLYKIILASILPREGATDQMSWDQKHLMLFLIRSMPVDIPQYIFNHLCQSLRETQSKKKRTVIPYGRLISEIFYQGKLIQKLEQIGAASEAEMGTSYGKIINGMMLFHMNCGYKKNNIISDQNDIKLVKQVSTFMDDFPPISKEDNLEVIAIFVKQHFLETGQKIDISMLPETAEGAWKAPRKRSVKVNPTEAEADKVASDLAKSLLAAKSKSKPSGSQKEKVVKAQVYKKRPRKLIVEEEDEEINQDAILTSKGKGLKHLKSVNPETFSKLASGQATEVQKLSQELKELDSAKASELMQQKMQVKRESVTAAHSEGKHAPTLTTPTPTSNSEPINLESSPEDDQPISKSFKLTKPALKTTLPVSEESSDSSDTESDNQPPPENQPTPIQVEQPIGFASVASKYVDASLAHIAQNNPRFAVHHAVFTANKNLADRYQSENSPVLDNLSQHYLGGELPGYQPSPHQTEATSTSPTKVASEPEPQQQTTSPQPSVPEASNLEASETATQNSPPPTSETIPIPEPLPETTPLPEITPITSPTKPVSEDIPPSEDQPQPISETTNLNPSDVIMVDASEDSLDSESSTTGSEQNIPSEPEQSSSMPASSRPSQPPTLNLNPDLQARCMAIFSELQDLINMKDLVVLPPTFNHLWEALRMKLDQTLDSIQEMVMDSHLQAASKWFEEIAASMNELKLKTDINRQLRSTAVNTSESGTSATVEVTAPWVEELLRPTSRSHTEELEAELRLQKKKQHVLEAKIAAMAADQKLMKEQQEALLQNQAQANQKMDTMLELLLKMQKP